MKRFYILFIIYATSDLAFAQELIYNGGFEEHYCLPQKISEPLCCKGWNEFNWIPSGNPKYGTPDYYMDSALYSLSSIATTDCEIATHSGTATMRIGVFRKSLENYREYIATHLMEPLEPGATYSLSFWVNNGSSFPDNSNLGYACTGLGMLFTTERITAVPHQVIPRKPHLHFKDRVWVNEWREYHFDFLADSAYEYLTFGFFQDDSEISCVDYLAFQPDIPENRSGYYFMDGISLERKEGAFGDSVICVGDSAALNAFYRNGDYTWIETSRPDVILSQSDQLVVKPSVTTTYAVYSGQKVATTTVRVVADTIDVLRDDAIICDGDELELSIPADITDFSWQDGTNTRQYYATKAGRYRVDVFDHHCVSSDSLKLDVWFCDCEAYVPNAFTPNNDRHNDFFKPIIDCPVYNYHLSIFNRWGEIAFETSSVEEGWNGMSSGKEAGIGSYVYRLKYNLYDGTKHDKKGIINLLR